MVGISNNMIIAIPDNPRKKVAQVERKTPLQSFKHIFANATVP